MALSEAEKQELAELEKDEAKREEDAADAIARQHLQALKLKKTLATKYGVCGVDFDVVETTAGNFAFRRPRDVEVDGIDTSDESRASGENFIKSIVIFPEKVEDVGRLLSEFPTLGQVLAKAAFALTGEARKADSKK
jgi:hypothetical protein